MFTSIFSVSSFSDFRSERIFDFHEVRSVANILHETFHCQPSVAVRACKHFGSLQVAWCIFISNLLHSIGMLTAKWAQNFSAHPETRRDCWLLHARSELVRLPGLLDPILEIRCACV